MDTVTNLRTFMAVVRYASFSEASRHLHVVPSVVAKRIAQLEKTMGAKLFERTTRTVTTTHAGQRLQAQATSLIAGFDGLVDTIRHERGEPGGHIRLMAPTTLTTLKLGDVINGFLLAHRQITMEVALADHSTNPVEQSFDMVISGRAAHYDGVEQVPLAPVQTGLYASPLYLNEHPAPQHPGEVPDHPCLVFRPSGSSWVFQSGSGPVFIDVPARLTADDNVTLLHAAMSGLGLAVLPWYVAASAVQRGQLVTLLPDHPPQETWFKAFIPRRQAHQPRIQALCQWLTERLPQALVRSN